MRLLFIPTAALVCCIASGCVSDSTRAYNAAQSFLSAMQKGDLAAGQAAATQAARPNLAMFFENKQASESSFTLGTPKFAGESAEIPMTLTSAKSQPAAVVVLLRREENEWRVWALRLKAEHGEELTLDFEHPERIVGEALGAALGELAKGLESLGKDSEKAGRALGEALGGFAKGFAQGMEKSAPPTKPTTDDTLTPPVLK